MLDLYQYARELHDAGLTREKALTEVNKAVFRGEMPPTLPAEVVGVVDSLYPSVPPAPAPRPPAPEPEAVPTGAYDVPEDKAAPTIRFLDLSDEVGLQPEALPQVVRGILPREHIMQVVAKGGVGKTFLGMNLMFAVVTGGEWLGFGCERGRVLYIDPELHPDLIKQRIRAITTARGIDRQGVRGMFEYVSLRGTVATAGTLLDAIRDRAASTGAGYDLIVIDSINCIMEGDENSATDMRRFYASLQAIVMQMHSAIVTFHHTGKGEGKAKGEAGRGSSVLFDAPDTCIEIRSLNVKPDTTAWDVLRTHDQRRYDGTVVRASAWRMSFPKVRGELPIEPRDVIFRHPLHLLDATGELADCKEAGSDADNGGKGGDAKGESYKPMWDQMNETLGAIVDELHAEGAKATRAACLEVLNERRKAQGMEPWSKATFRNATLPKGKLRFRIDRATNELHRLSDEDLQAEQAGGAVPDTP